MRTSSQYLIRMTPEWMIDCSTAGAYLRKYSTCSLSGEAHDPLHAGPVVPTAIEDHHFAGGGQIGHVALEVHL